MTTRGRGGAFGLEDGVGVGRLWLWSVGVDGGGYIVVFGEEDFRSRRKKMKCEREMFRSRRKREMLI